MKTQKRKNAKTQTLNLSTANSLTLNKLREDLEISSLTQTIKLLQKIRRDKLAKQRRQK